MLNGYNVGLSMVIVDNDERESVMQDKSCSSQETKTDTPYIGLRLEDVVDGRAKRASSHWNTRRK